MLFRSLRALPRIDYRRLAQPIAAQLPFWLSLDASVGLISRAEPSANPASRLKSSLFEHLELFPRVSLPVRFGGSSVNAELGFRVTHYGNKREQQSLDSGTLTRGVTNFNLEWRPPALSRLFPGAGWLSRSSVRHVIEPAIRFNLTSGAGDFREILVFDEQDLVSNTRELEYSLTNRILAGRADGPEGVDELLSFEVKQQYYFRSDFGGALVTGRRNVFLSPLSLTGSAFLDRPRRFSPVVSYLRLRPAQHLEVELQIGRAHV